MTDLAALARAVSAGAPAAPGSILGVAGDALRLALPGARLGERLALDDDALVEVVGFDGAEAVALPLTPTARLESGGAIRRVAAGPVVFAGDAVVGRILDALGRPIDGGQPLPTADWPTVRRAPDPLTRRPVDRPFAFGVRAIDGLCTVGAGQRLALEAGPGAGKSTLLAQMAAQADAEVVVLALVGERGREIGAFLRGLPAAARARSVVVVARADDPPLAWLRAAQTATALAEWFRDAGRDVLLLLDSLTRVARAVRTVGVAAGEPTTRRGFPASLSTVIAGLLERAANGPVGTLTAVYTVLVEGDRADDPVAEEARALLDGHIALDGALAGAGRFPAIDLRHSVSRCMDALVPAAHRAAARRARGWLDALARNHDLIQLGAYAKGADAATDEALRRRDALEGFLRQAPDEATDFETTSRRLRALAG